MTSHPSREGYALPRRDDENNAKWDALDVAAETWLVRVGKSDVLEGLLGNGEHVIRALECSANFTGNLLDWAVGHHRIAVNTATAERTHRPICRVSSRGISSFIFSNSSYKPSVELRPRDGV